MFKKIMMASTFGMVLFLSGCTSDEERAQILKDKMIPILKAKKYELISVSNYDHHPKQDNIYADFVVKDPCGEKRDVKYVQEYGYAGDFVDDVHYLSLQIFKDKKNTQKILDNYGLDIVTTTKTDDGIDYTGTYKCGKSFNGSILYDENFISSNEYQLIIKLPIED